VLPAVALLLALAVPSATAAEPIPELEGLSFNASGSASPSFSRPRDPWEVPVRSSSATSSDVSIEFPGATSKLQARYPLDGRLLKEAIVESGTANDRGPRSLRRRPWNPFGLDQSSSGMELRFEEGRQGGRGKPRIRGSGDRIGVGDKLEIAVFVTTI